MTTVLEVAVGVSLLYLLIALVVTAVQELIASILHLRAKHLYRTLAAVLTGKVHVGANGKPEPLVAALYEHPLIRSLGESARALPSYIPSRTFALALLDVLQATKTPTEAVGARELLTNARALASNVSDPELQRVLTLLVGEAERAAHNVDERSQAVTDRLESWFNDCMDRASGSYKRRSQLWSLGLALALTITFNADTLYVATRLWADEALRSAVVASARAIGESPAGTGADVAQLLAHVDQIARSGLPLGWRTGAPLRPTSVFGWLITALAASLGAPFWFDVLSKTIRFRGTGPKVSATTGRTEARVS